MNKDIKIRIHRTVIRPVISDYKSLKLTTDIIEQGKSKYIQQHFWM